MGLSHWYTVDGRTHSLFTLIELTVTHLCFVQSHHSHTPHHSCIMRMCPLASERSGLTLPGTPRLGHAREAISLRTQPPLLCNSHSPAWSSRSILQRYLTPHEPILVSDLCYSVGTARSWMHRPFHVSYCTGFDAFYGIRFHVSSHSLSPYCIRSRLTTFALVLLYSLSSYHIHSHLTAFALVLSHSLSSYRIRSCFIAFTLVL